MEHLLNCCEYCSKTHLSFIATAVTNCANIIFEVYTHCSAVLCHSALHSVMEHIRTFQASWCSYPLLSQDIGGGAREGSVYWDSGWFGCCCLIPNGPQHSWHIIHTIILTPEGDVASSTHIGGSWVGLTTEPVQDTAWTTVGLVYRETTFIPSCHQQQDISEVCRMSIIPTVPDAIQHNITAKNLKDSILLWLTGYFPHGTHVAKNH